MAQYGVLVYAPTPADPASVSAEDLKALEAYPQQVAELGGKILGGYALQASTSAKAVRGGNLVDGLFAPAEQVIAGIYVLEAPDLDTAVAIARRDPAAQRGGVEVRPLFGPPSE